MSTCMHAWSSHATCTLAQLRPLSSIWMHGDVLAIQLVWHTLVSHVSSSPISVSSSISSAPPPPCMYVVILSIPLHPKAAFTCHSTSGEGGEAGKPGKQTDPPRFPQRIRANISYMETICPFWGGRKTMFPVEGIPASHRPRTRWDQGTTGRGKGIKTGAFRKRF